MRVLFFIIALATILVGGCSPRSADSAPMEAPPSTKAINTICPVRDEEVKPGLTVGYKGRTIGFCCKKCLGEFSARPEDFVARIPEFSPK